MSFSLLFFSTTCILSTERRFGNNYNKFGDIHSLGNKRKTRVFRFKCKICENIAKIALKNGLNIYISIHILVIWYALLLFWLEYKLMVMLVVKLVTKQVVKLWTSWGTSSTSHKYNQGRCLNFIRNKKMWQVCAFVCVCFLLVVWVVIYTLVLIL